MTTTTAERITRYTRHYCPRNHRTMKTLTACLWPRAHWVLSYGNYASVSKCRGTTVWLWPTPAEALAAKAAIDATYCGGRCTGRHQVIELLDPSQMEAQA